jgi:hypothetical protein
MRLLADLHISPSTVFIPTFLGHDIIRVTAALPPTADDAEIIAYAPRKTARSLPRIWIFQRS